MNKLYYTSNFNSKNFLDNNLENWTLEDLEFFLNYLLEKRGKSNTLNNEEKQFFSELETLKTNRFSSDLYLIYYFVDSNGLTFKNAIIKYYIMYFSHTYNYSKDLINDEKLLNAKYKEIGKSSERNYLFFDEIKLYKLLTDLRRNRKLSLLELKMFKLLKAINSGRTTNKQAYINIENTPRNQLKLKENEVGLRIEDVSRDISREEYLQQVEENRKYLDKILGMH